MTGSHEQERQRLVTASEPGPDPAGQRATVVLSDSWTGPLLMLAAAACAAFAWTATRTVALEIGGPSTVFIRTLMLLAVLSPWFLFNGRSMLVVFRSRLHLLRLVAVGLSVTCFTVALGLAPLAEVTALSFTAPLFVLLLARLFDAEPVGLARWIGVAVGLVGIALVVAPPALASPTRHIEGALIAVGGAFCLATAWTSVRRLHEMRQSLGVLIAPPLVTTVLVSGAFALPQLTLPSLRTLPVLAVAAVFTLLAHTLQCLSFRYGRPARVAPIDYTRLLFAVACGALVLNELPSQHALIGAALIVGAALQASMRIAPLSPPARRR